MGRKRMLLVIALMLTLIICGGMVAEYIVVGRAVAQTGNLAWGSSGAKVSEVQRKLKQWGYYDGPISGNYGPLTFEAVRFFQRRNGLKVDGVVGTQTANALGIRLGGAAATTPPAAGGGGQQGDVYLMARAVHGEARGEPYIGKVAVAAVILNRVRHPDYPNTIAGVIYQPLAFTAVADGQINLTPDEESLRAVRDAMNGWDPSYGAIFYYNPATATSRWIFGRPVHITIGKHRFAT